MNFDKILFFSSRGIHYLEGGKTYPSICLKNDKEITESAVRDCPLSFFSESNLLSSQEEFAKVQHILLFFCKCMIIITLSCLLN